jgi:hypothetical protein
MYADCFATTRHVVTQVRRKSVGVYELYDRLYASPLYQAYRHMGFHHACRAMRKATLAAWSAK